MKLKNSLSSKYLLLILVAMMIFPLSFPIVSLLVYMPLEKFDNNMENTYQNGNDIEKIWHEEAKKLEGKTPEEINQRLIQLKNEYSKASMFWVNQDGIVEKRLPESIQIPSTWTPTYTVDFMKKSYGFEADPFTVVAFIGENKNKGFMVIQVPRSAMISTGQIIQERYDLIMIIGTLTILGLFVFISWIFFYKIRKRLTRIQDAMANPTETGIPNPLEIDKKDEIGQLVESFNSMIHQLEVSRKREQEDEDLRRQLIANLSHDLRTPLTTIRGHAYSLKKEGMSQKGHQSLELIDKKVNYLGQLIENLLSYTLLSAGKYPFEPKETDIVRIVRMSVATWYPVFEKEEFDIELTIPDHPIYWKVDPGWFDRILDNLFQNIIRHANSGKYVAVKIEHTENQTTLTIEDQGPGMGGESSGKGAGIGLSIVALMTKEMNLKWNVSSSENGTKMIISSQLIE